MFQKPCDTPLDPVLRQRRKIQVERLEMRVQLPDMYGVRGVVEGLPSERLVLPLQLSTVHGQALVVPTNPVSQVRRHASSYHRYAFDRPQS
jgi:hypothetical protein